MIARIVSSAVLVAVLGSPAWADPRSVDPTSVVIRIWGDDALASTIKGLEDVYRSRHPDVRFETRLLGSDTGIAGLYTGVSDIAILGRNIRPVEALAYSWVFKHPPAGVAIATGSIATPRHSPAVAILTNPRNPIDHVTLPQLDALLGLERRLGATRAMTTWGDLGVTGASAQRKIHVYLRDVEKGTADVLRAKILGGSRKWRWAQIQEFDDRADATGHLVDADDAILAAVAQDPDGLGLARPPTGAEHVKAIAVAETDAGPFVRPERNALIEGTYPLARQVMAYANTGKDGLLPAPVAAFLRFVVETDGQNSLVGAGDCLPLDETHRRAALKALSR